MARVRMASGWTVKLDEEVRTHALEPLTDDVYRDAIRFTPIDTGKLVSRIQKRVTTRSGRVFVRGLEAQKLIWVEYGTAPHLIRPTRKKALHWEGARYPVKLVKHPGTRAQAPFRRAVYRYRSKL